MRKKFSIISLGCFRNTYDSEIIANKFSKQGYIFNNQKTFRLGQNQDLLLINTCGFIDKAKEESIDIIKEAVLLKKKKKVKKIIVFGCLVQRYQNTLKRFFPEVDEWQPVVSFSPNFTKRKKIERSYFDFLKICEGCINKCSFCAIPLIKGELHSRSSDEIIKEARYLDRQKIKELNIIGQDITSWGKDLKENNNLTDLLKKILANTKNIKWIRLIYTHPRNFSDSLIELIAKEKRICKYIDLPIQHINDRILKLMNRGITKEKIMSLIRKIREKIPSCAIRTAVIVGFPGEKEEEFRELLNFLKETKFNRLGAFIYSREENTPAYNFSSQIHYRTKKRRYNEVMSLQQKIAQQLNSSFIGKKMKVLIEKIEEGFALARTEYDAPEVDGVVFIKKRGLQAGDFYQTKIIDAYGYDLVGV
ncbi:MAG: MiaB/RimO family radical SAM methylthiotransferase [Candidatus Omnitrophica bacterium]|jgi:ribosomal protein S12 methylthiotransferase|nr:MiaB/RimO family radical SAM methylthiotransferase [Candidatus Omnitrophota bacterium]